MIDAAFVGSILHERCDLCWCCVSGFLSAYRRERFVMIESTVWNIIAPFSKGQFWTLEPPNLAILIFNLIDAVLSVSAAL